MTQFSDMLKNWTIVGIVIFSILAFGNAVQSDNGVSTSEKFTNDSTISSAYLGIENVLSESRSNAQSQREAFETDNPTAGATSILLYSILGTGKTLSSFIIGIFNFIVTLPTVFLGVDPVVVSAFSALLVALGVLYLWATYNGSG